jgi:hypothetical protein
MQLKAMAPGSMKKPDMTTLQALDSMYGMRSWDVPAAIHLHLLKEAHWHVTGCLAPKF